MDKVKLCAWLSVIGALVAGAAFALFAQTPPQAYSSLSFHLTLFLGVNAAVVHPAAAGLFVWGLGRFKPELRSAYLLICAGIVLIGLAQMQIPILAYFQLGESWWVQKGVVIMPYLIPTVLLFLGVKRFARLFNIQTLWASFWAVCAVSVVISILLTYLPHAIPTRTELEFRASVALGAWASLVLAASGVLSWQIRKVASAIFKSALTWFAVGLYAIAFGGLVYIAIYIAFGDKNVFIDHGVSLVPYLLSGMAFVVAGVAFKRINEGIKPQADIQSTGVSLLDVLTFVAAQVSNPRQVEPILEEMRVITSGLIAGQKMSPNEEKQLRQIYQKLRSYLIEKENIRQFTPSGLRQEIANYFSLSEDDLARLVGQ